MSLIGSSKMIANASMRARVEAAIRQTAVGKVEATDATGRLAAQGLADPASLASHFLARLSVNPAVAAEACGDCGHAGVPDDSIAFVVAEAWSDVAEIVYPVIP